MASPHRLRGGVLIAAVLITLTCCKMAPPRGEGPRAQPGHAAELLKAGDLKGTAALLWEQAASQPSPQREDLQLRAVETLLTPKTAPLARQYLDEVLKEELRGPLLVRARIAQARLALLEGQPTIALRALPPGISLATPQFEKQVDELRAQALLDTGQILQSVRTRVALAPKLTDHQAIVANQQKLWRALGRASEQQISRWAQDEMDKTLRGWLALGYIAKTSPTDSRLFDRELNAWRQQYPHHPAANMIIGQLRRDWRQLQLSPRKIAVILPLTGPYASIAKAVQTGFMAAYYTDDQAHHKPSIRVYDVGESGTDVWEQYMRAVREGAQLVVGPLDKVGVDALAGRRKLPVPVLSLNYSERPSNPPNNLYEFGLLPEDEARQVAERARLAGYQTALTLAPQGEWGERLLNAFRRRFEELGGLVLDTARYDPNGTDFSAPIKDVLGIDLSEQRCAELRTLLRRDLQCEPRRRPDADMLFMAALPRPARLLRPQLRFNYATDLPVYATSHIYTGVEDVRSDRDIDGVIYCDMPWMLKGANPEPQLRARLDSLFPSESQDLARLMALGVDAYRIIYYLKRLAARPYARYTGLTGNLYMDDLGRIHRELDWARFVDGEPTLLGNALSQPSSGAVAAMP
jgi:outer membrane PBP1 activator LpoA protein